MGQRKAYVCPSLECLEARRLLAFNVSISNAATNVVPTLDGSTRVYSASAGGANVQASDIASDLSSGAFTGVRIDTGTSGGQQGDITVSSSILVTLSAAKTLTLRADRNVTFTSAAITASGNRLDVVLNSDRDNSGFGAVLLDGGTVITSNGGDITIGGASNPSTMPARGTSVASGIGVFIDGATLSSGTGNISILGQGQPNAANFNIGVQVAGGTVQSTSGNVTIRGTGGGSGGASDKNRGVSVVQNGVVQVNTGQMSIVGVGGTGDSSGVRLVSDDLSTFGRLLSTSTGSITVEGTGHGSGANRGRGLVMDHASSQIGGASAQGNITVKVNELKIDNGSLQSSGELTIQPVDPGTPLTIALGTGPVGTLRIEASAIDNIVDGFLSVTFGDAVNTTNVDVGAYAGFRDPLTIAGDSISATAAFSLTSGNVLTLVADNVDIAGGALLTGPGGVTIRPETANRPIRLGTEQSGELSLTDLELDRVVSATKVTVGSTAAGDVTFSAPISMANASTLEVITVDDVTQNFSGTALSDDSLIVAGDLAPGLAGTGTFNVNGSVTFDASASYEVNLNGTADHDQLIVAGSGRTTTLGGADLVITRDTVPAPFSGDVFRIIDSTGTGSTVSGTFKRLGTTLNNNDTFTVGSTTFRINYNPLGSPGDVILTEAQSPPQVNLSVSTNSGTETDQTAITVTATADSPVVGNQTVNLAVSGTGITPSDYTLVDVPIDILNGQTMGQATFTVEDDDVLEALIETATLTLHSPSAGLTLGSTISQDIAITDNDSAAVTVENVAGTEGTGLEFTVTLDNAVQGAFTVDVTLIDVSATGGAAPLVSPEDYDNVVAQLDFSGSAGETEQFTVATLGDLILEAAETFTVSLSASNTRVTDSDPATGTIDDDGVCDFEVTNTNDAGPGSLRDMITCANNAAGVDTITFNIPGAGPHTITPLSALPLITDPVMIDGTTEPDFSAGVPAVELNGSSAGAGAHGLRISAGGSTVRGLAINRFSSTGIVLEIAGGNTIQHNRIGTNPAGDTDLGNASHGVVVINSSNNLIGGPTTNEANVISGNGGHGIHITGAGSTNNDVKSNIIGLGADGLVELGNTGAGVRIDQDASGNSIGGSGNLISGNGTSGVLIVGAGATNNTLAGNLIGTDVSGFLNRGNGAAGVVIDNAPGNQIGVPGDGNVISGNGTHGVFISGASASGNFVQGNQIGLITFGTAALSNGKNGVYVFNSPGNTIGGTAADAGNVVSGNDQTGILIAGSNAAGNHIEGNFVGTNSLGTSAVANGDFGIVLRDAPNNTVGGTAAGSRNVVSGNAIDGVAILAAQATGNVVIGNLIGTDRTGSADVGNARSGVLVWKAPGNRIGGLTAAERNIVSGNNLFGIRVSTSLTGVNVIQGNYVGTDITGTVALPNSDSGVQLANSENVTVGGGTPGARNIISGNGNHGVSLAANAAFNNIQGNFIGLDANGTTAIGNVNIGVRTGNNAHDNTVGGDSTAGEGNVISGNSVGVLLSSGNNMTVAGNLIGTDHTGTVALGNSTNGVTIYQAQTNTIGGTTAGAGNVISENGGFGVVVADSNTTGNKIQGNSIGTDITGTVDLGNSSVGVFLSAPNNTIGGTAAGAGNLISGNDLGGVRINGANGIQIQGNIIGPQIDGTSPLGSTGHGVRIQDGSNIDIGGTMPGAANVIAHQTGHGVAIVGNSTTNAIERNSMFSNGGLGIDLNQDGVTVNDTSPGSEDIDTGPNNLQNFPVLGQATLSGTDLELTYSVPSSTLHAVYPLFIEFFLAGAAGQEGRTFLGGDVYVPLEALMPAMLTIDVTGLGVTGSSQIVTTAADFLGNTSEFSAPLTVSVPLHASGEPALSADACRAFGIHKALDTDGMAILTESLPGIVDAAVVHWQAAGASPEQLSVLSEIDIHFAQLDGNYLGLTTGQAIKIDSDAAGYGWYIDETPLDSSEFDGENSYADDRMDLLTAVMHEIGHLLGHADLADDNLAEDVMFAWLKVGERRLP